MSRKPLIALSIFFICCTAFLMKNWLVPGLPLSPREENIPEVSYLWNLYHGINSGFTLDSWNPSVITGVVNRIQRGYFIFTPLAIGAKLTSISPDLIYRLAVFGILLLSGIGMAFYIKKTGCSWKTATIIGLYYLAAPPHLAIGLEGFDFNVYWALVPWILYSVELFGTGRKQVVFHSALFGNLLGIASIVGTTYFAATIPFLMAFIIMRLLLLRSKKMVVFLLFGGIFFISFNSFITLPSIIEGPASWISQETLRKNLPNSISFYTVASLFIKKLTNHSLSSFTMNGNFADMSWYLSIPISILALIGIVSLKQHRKLIVPIIVFLFIGFFVFIVPSFYLKKIAMLLLSVAPRMQALYDHTFRLFLFVVLFQCVSAAVGLERILHFFRHKAKVLVFVIILLIVLVDLYPFHRFFKINQDPTLFLDGQKMSLVNTGDKWERYYLPFPYKKHLPLYKYEYLSRYIQQNRVNSQYLYIPYSGRYSGELFDTLLAGGLETGKVSFSVFKTVMTWGNVRFIIFLKEVANYNMITHYLVSQGFQKQETERMILLTRNDQQSYVELTSNFQPIPPQYTQTPAAWLDAAEKNLNYYDNSKLNKSNRVELNTANLITLKHEIPTTIHLEVQAETETLATISEAYFPGWRVVINGKEGDIVRSNYAFLGTIIPAGKHSITFSYHHPWYYTVGLMISSANFVLTGSIFALRVKQKLKHRSQTA